MLNIKVKLWLKVKKTPEQVETKSFFLEKKNRPSNSDILS